MDSFKAKSLSPCSANRGLPLAVVSWTAPQVCTRVATGEEIAHELGGEERESSFG